MVLGATFTTLLLFYLYTAKQYYTATVFLCPWAL